MPTFWARMMIPISSVIPIVPSNSNVVAAFRDFGLRKAGTPLLIASTPVSAAHPDEKARATKNAKAIPYRCESSACNSKLADSARTSSPSTYTRVSPHTSISTIPNMNA